MPIAQIQPVPLVKPWFLGMINVRGVLYAINDIAQLLENSLTGLTSNTRMLLVSDAVTQNVAFIVNKLIGLRRLDEMTLGSEISSGSICLKAQTYLDADNKIWHLMDCRQLVSSKEFQLPYAN